jgi:hypothetical protein
MSEKDDEARAAMNVPADSSAPVAVFINYRRADTQWAALSLYDYLEPRYGADNVFLDTESMKPGDIWRRSIQERGGASGVVFLALIGRDWARLLRERPAHSDEVRREIEMALRRDSGERVIPVLVDGATIPENLDPSLRRLTEINAAFLRREQLRADRAALVELIDETARAPLPEIEQQPEASPGVATVSGRLHASVPTPGPDHFAAVADALIKRKRFADPVVVVVGAGVNGSDGYHLPWRDETSGRLPTTDELAAYLAREFDLGLGQEADLARVSQVIDANSSTSLYRALRPILAASYPPTSVHRFLAGLPGRIAARGYANRYQLIITSTYDTALERAFDDANEPYDLVVYVPNGNDRGKFRHKRWDSNEQVLIDDPAAYNGLPLVVGDATPFERTIIVKIHGGIDPADGGAGENCVLTEDQYIDYVVGENIPKPMVAQIQSSPCLYLGHSMRDWNLRVFLHRAFAGKLPRESWAVEREPDEIERMFMKRLNATLYAAPLGDYVGELAACIDAQPPAARP